ncbi:MULTISPECIES: baseplate J/gp47 family protein [unclassified Dehalobacter]|uniref:baseplate J/gp47 family protein n=1 Tax=unclassified Dehalobacter TaxID=2635733 RepID=UPI001048C6DF|nr:MULTISPECIES: baseplate J/gp47 family protein [unclassified Dehalobacter]TCX51919.1 hypothetical protein C1I36_06270 [Dehalobacter sp. 14DCB1]TCX52979.1 hypothetical protein C1I38_07950 [Dehalobacter sp. 12DCB1]
MFEDRTYENILNEMLDLAPASVDTRQGSVFYDMMAPAALMLARYYTELNTTIELVFLDTAAGAYLEEKCREHAVYRLPATPNVRSVTFTGASVAANQRFFAEGQYFVTKYDEDAILVVEAETPGVAANVISAGTALVPVNTIPGLTAATLGATITPGSEAESDDNLRRRLREKIAGPAANGNKQHYKTWCEEISGVGLARIDPLWNGNNTVKGILIDTEGLPVSSSIVDEVQDYIDPGGTGMGEGVANIGCHFTAVAASAYTINIAFDAQLAPGTTAEDIEVSAAAAIAAYFKEVSLASTDNSAMIIRTAAIANAIYDLAGLVDYANLTINGGTANISVPYTDVPVVGVVNVG